MTRYVEIRIEMPDGEVDTTVLLSSMTIVSSAEEISPEAIPAVLLKAVETIIQGRLMSGYREHMPMLSGEYLDMICASEARLALIDTVMHLPVTGEGSSIETTIPR